MKLTPHVLVYEAVARRIQHYTKNMDYFTRKEIAILVSLETKDSKVAFAMYWRVLEQNNSIIFDAVEGKYFYNG